MDTSDSSPPNISVFPYEIQFLSDLLAGEVQRYRALVELSNISQATQIGEKVADQEILVNQLGAFRLKGYQDVVSFPPKLEPVPVKPLFFDAAWNYIDYPGRDGQNKVPVTSLEKPLISRDEISQQKKGWFGFGR
jgi:signal recognition particle subunit SRP68